LTDLYLEEYKEKLVNNIDLEKAWGFINRESIFINGLSKTNVARAISIQSIIYYEGNSEISKMALVLTAIEALYARGNTGTSSQLVEKNWFISWYITCKSEISK